MKRFGIALILTLLCAGLLCAAACAEIVSSGRCGSDEWDYSVTWTLDDNGVMTVSGTG